MKHIAIVAPSGQSNMSSVVCIVDSFEILSEVNLFWEKRRATTSTKLKLLGYPKELVTIKPHVDITTSRRLTSSSCENVKIAAIVKG
jgi:hypothetical protein